MSDEARSLRNALGTFATGVTIVTTRRAGRRRCRPDRQQLQLGLARSADGAVEPVQDLLEHRGVPRRRAISPCTSSPPTRMRCPAASPARAPTSSPGSRSSGRCGHPAAARLRRPLRVPHGIPVRGRRPRHLRRRGAQLHPFRPPAADLPWRPVWAGDAEGPAAGARGQRREQPVAGRSDLSRLARVPSDPQRRRRGTPPPRLERGGICRAQRARPRRRQDAGRDRRHRPLP